jgi:hypothetical protein
MLSLSQDDLINFLRRQAESILTVRFSDMVFQLRSKLSDRKLPFFIYGCKFCISVFFFLPLAHFHDHSLFARRIYLREWPCILHCLGN